MDTVPTAHDHASVPDAAVPVVVCPLAVPLAQRAGTGVRVAGFVGCAPLTAGLQTGVRAGSIKFAEHAPPTADPPHDQL